MNEEILCSVQMTQLRSFIVRMTFDPIHLFRRFYDQRNPMFRSHLNVFIDCLTREKTSSLDNL